MLNLGVTVGSLAYGSYCQGPIGSQHRDLLILIPTIAASLLQTVLAIIVAASLHGWAGLGSMAHQAPEKADP